MLRITTRQSESGLAYVLVREADGWVCSCRGYQFRGDCRHVEAAQAADDERGASGAVGAGAVISV